MADTLKPCPRCRKAGTVKREYNLSPAQWLECSACGFRLSDWDSCWNEVSDLTAARTIAADTIVTDAMIKAGWKAQSQYVGYDDRRMAAIYLAMQAARTIDDAPDARPDVVERAALAMATVIAERHGHHKPEDWLNDQRREEARAAIAALQPIREVEAMQWQPIETAPQDGTEFLAWVRTAAGGRVTTVEWSGGQWVESYDLAGWMPKYGPTHWMPLPNAPDAALAPKDGE